MAKDREHITTNGRAAFYACMWEDFRNKAMDCGWALGLHGSLNSDMDIMAMPWTNEAVSADELIENLGNLFTDNPFHRVLKSLVNEKPNGRIVYTIPIWSDFYLDINVIESN